MPVLEKPPAGGGEGLKATKDANGAWIIVLSKEDQKLSTAVKVIYE